MTARKSKEGREERNGREREKDREEIRMGHISVTRFQLFGQKLGTNVKFTVAPAVLFRFKGSNPSDPRHWSPHGFVSITVWILYGASLRGSESDLFHPFPGFRD